jgi:hypothetical protein
MTTTIDGTAYGPESVLAACSQQDANTVQILLPYNYGEDNKPTWQPGEVDRTQVDASFKSNALGDYSFETTIIPA